MTLNEITKEQLKEMYIEKDMTLQQIAEKLGTTRFKVSDRLKELGIEKEARLRTRHKDMPNKEQIEDLYLNKNMTIKEVASYFGISYQSVIRLNKKYNITKSKDIVIKQRADSHRKKVGVSVEDTTWRDKVIEVYINQNNTRKKTAEILGISLSRVLAIIEHYNIVKSKELNRERMKKTNLEKYGHEYATQSKETLDKMRKTNLERYGVSHPWNRPKSHERGIETKKEKRRERMSLIDDNLKKYLAEHKDATLSSISKDLKIPYSSTSALVRELGHVDEVNYPITALESKFKSFLEEYNIEYTIHDRQQIKPKELDFYLPKYNIGIEINDTASHNSTIPYKDSDICTPRYHFDKTKLAIDNNVHLIHIFEYEIDDAIRYNKILNYLKSLLDIETKRVYARNCVIKEVSTKEANEFLDNYHLQNKAHASIKLGLYYKDELVELMTFGRPRYNKNYEYELIRLCTKFGYKVVGGSQKLFKYFLNTFNPTTVISYCDISKFTGNVYKSLGFTFIDYTQPNYIWTNFKTTLPRYSTQKQKLLSILNIENQDNLTEDAIMENLGYLRVYDCGNAKYVYTKNI